MRVSEKGKRSVTKEEDYEHSLFMPTATPLISAAGETWRLKPISHGHRRCPLLGWDLYLTDRFPLTQEVRN
jgi:hypothetical protein